MKGPQKSGPYYHVIDNEKFHDSVHEDRCERKRENESSKSGGKFRKGLMSNWTTNFMTKGLTRKQINFKLYLLFSIDYRLYLFCRFFLFEAKAKEVAKNVARFVWADFVWNKLSITKD